MAKRTTTPNRRRQPIAPKTDVASDATRSDSMASEPSEEAIRLRAYQRFLARAGQPGNDFDDWIEAERELREGVLAR